jgi:integrase
MPLTDTAIRKAKPADKPVRMFDGGGLYLEVAPAGGKWWRLKYRFGGKEKRLSLGVYPDVGLAEARRRREEARKLVAAGADPSAARKAEKASRAGADSFEAIAREWIDTVHSHEVSEAHCVKTQRRFEAHVFPWLGAKRIEEITPPELLQTIRRIETTGSVETAHRALRSCGQVFRYGIATGRCERDPSPDLRGALKPLLTKHYAAIVEPKRVGELLRAVDGYTGQPVTRAALQLAALLFQRPGNLRTMEWTHVDLDEGLWTIPAEQMKGRRQAKASGMNHLVPLPRQAVEILRQLQPITGAGRYVFPSLRTTTRPMSDGTLNAALRRLGYSRDDAVAHGFRATARTMLAERLGVEEAAIEAQLAHGVRDSLGRAYNRTTFVEQRRSMMQTWADYLDKLQSGAEVIPFKAA